MHPWRRWINITEVTKRKLKARASLKKHRATVKKLAKEAYLKMEQNGNATHQTSS